MILQFRNKLHIIRKQNKLSQRELGDLVGLSSKMIGKYERGDAEPTLGKILSLCNSLNCTPNELITTTEN